MDVPAFRADLTVDQCAASVAIGIRQVYTGNLEPVSFMIDICLRSKFRNRKESRTLQISPFIFGSRNISGNRQTRETVTGQESFTGKVPVWIKIRVHTFRTFQCDHLLVSLIAQGFCNVTGRFITAAIHGNAVLPFLLISGTFIKHTPALTGLFKSLINLSTYLIQPFFAPPGRILKRILHFFQNMVCHIYRFITISLIQQSIFDILLYREFIRIMMIDNVRHF